MRLETKIFFLILIATFTMGCSSDQQSSGSLAIIDVRNNYPEKEIVLTDIADITYLHLSAKNEDFLYKGSINYATNNTIAIHDQSSGSILFFTKDGNPKSRFNRYGQGPEEYSRPFLTILYDEVTDDVFVAQNDVNFVQVYSSTGEYKRKLTLPQGVRISQIVIFDDQSLLAYDESKLWRNMSRKQAADNVTSSTHYNDSAFFHISKMDGKVLEYVELPSNNVDFSIRTDGDVQIIYYTRIAKCSNGIHLCNPETDTVFLYGKDKSLTPVIRKKPLVGDLDPMLVLDNCMDAGNYLFMEIITNSASSREKPIERMYYALNKKNGEVFRQKNILPDFKGKELYFRARTAKFFENEYYFELELTELKKAYRENKLSGKLKELTASLDEFNDNNVFMLLKFK